MRIFWVFCCLLAPSAWADTSYHLSTAWIAREGVQELRAWTLDQFSGLKKASSREADPVTGKSVEWHGVLLSSVIEKAMEGLSPDRKAQVDLLVLKGSHGEEALLPRSLVTKYPIVLALKKNRDELGDRGPVYVVLPWTSKPRIQSEGLPLEKYFVAGLDRIELTTYRDHFTPYFLKRRTDPTAMRGEKIFLKNCITCHTGKPGPSILDLTAIGQDRALASMEHPAVKGMPKLSSMDRRAVVNYIDAVRVQNVNLKNPAPESTQTSRIW